MQTLTVTSTLSIEATVNLDVVNERVISCGMLSTRYDTQKGMSLSVIKAGKCFHVAGVWGGESRTWSK